MAFLLHVYQWAEAYTVLLVLGLMPLITAIAYLRVRRLQINQAKPAAASVPVEAK